ncbi:hypothetical protein JM946_29795, partial [Steroidobacter sp. S1-65]
MNEEVSFVLSPEKSPAQNDSGRSESEQNNASDSELLDSMDPQYRNGDLKPLSLIRLNRQQLETAVQSVPGGAPNVQDMYPLSPLQEGMLFHWLLNPCSDTYVLSILFELDSRASSGTLISALNRVMDRHDIMRSAVLWEDLPRPIQVVYRKATLPIEDLGRISKPLEQLRSRMKPGGNAWDLRRAPLLRLLLAGEEHGEKDYALLQVHHLISDHRSLRKIIEEVFACCDNRDHELPSPVAYRNYVAHVLADDRTHDAEGFFREALRGIDEPTAPFGLLDAHRDASRVLESHCQVDAGLARRIRTAANEFGVSAARLFHAAWALVVAHTCGKHDIVFGTVLLTSEQRGERSRRVLGMSVNTLPIRLRLKEASVKECLDQVNGELRRLFDYENTPLPIAQRCAEIASGVPLFTALLNYRHSPPEAVQSQRAEIGIRVIDRGDAWTNYPVALTVDDLQDRFVLTMQTDRSIEADRVAAYVEAALCSLVDSLEKNSQVPALSLSIMPKSERDLLIKKFNGEKRLYPAGKPISTLFEEQVKLVSERTAVLHEGQSLTYEELNCKANQLARYLVRKG